MTRSRGLPRGRATLPAEALERVQRERLCRAMAEVLVDKGYAATSVEDVLRRSRVRTEGVAEGFRPAEGVLLFEDPATTSKTPALERPAFAHLAGAAHPGDVLTVSELFRLCRDLVDIHHVRDWCAARGVALRVLSGPLSNFHDLAVPTRPAERTDRRGNRRSRGRRPLPRPATRRR